MELLIRNRGDDYRPTIDFIPVKTKFCDIYTVSYSRTVPDIFDLFVRSDPLHAGQQSQQLLTKYEADKCIHLIGMSDDEVTMQLSLLVTKAKMIGIIVKKFNILDE